MAAGASCCSLGLSLNRSCSLSSLISQKATLSSYKTPCKVYIGIIDCLEHDTAAVYTCQTRLIPFLKEMVPGVKQILYFSDGAASQYKNRFNVSNVAHHEIDFGLKAEWHFLATSHGQGPSDGLGGTLKREAARASLVLPIEKQIQTPTQLYEWAKSKLSGMYVAYVSETEISMTKKILQNRFNAAPAVTGIRTFHAALPQQHRIVFKYFSSSKDDAYSCNIAFRLLKTSDEELVETKSRKRRRTQSKQ